MSVIPQSQNAVPSRLEAAVSKWDDHAPLLHWDEQALAFIADKVGRAVCAWAEDWTAVAEVTSGGPGIERSRACNGAPQSQAWPALPLHADAAQASSEGAWLVHEKVHSDQRAIRPADLVGHKVCGGSTRVEPGSIAAELSQEAFVHLLTALRAALAIDGGTDWVDFPSFATALPEDAFREWAGGVRVTLPGLDDLALYIGGVTVARLGPPKRKVAAVEKRPLVALGAAVGPAQAALRAQLRPVELTLGQITSLQVGDVVVLPHALDRALDVSTGAGTLVCRAYLGRTGRHRSLEVLPLEPPHAA